jgi:hypothetical protein
MGYMKPANDGSGNMVWVYGEPKKPKSVLTKPKTAAQIAAQPKLIPSGSYLDQYGRLQVPGLPTSQSSLPNQPQSSLPNQPQSVNPNSASLRHERAQGANVGDKREFGGQLFRWNGVVWEREGGSQPNYYDTTKMKKHSSFISGLKSALPTFNTKRIGADISNIGHGLGQLTTSNLSQNPNKTFLEGLRNVAGGTIGSVGTIAAGLLAGPATSALRRIRGMNENQNPLEFGISEVMAAERVPQTAVSSRTENRINDQAKNKTIDPNAQKDPLEDDATDTREFTQSIIDETGIDDGTWGVELDNADLQVADIMSQLENQTLTSEEAEKQYLAIEQDLINKAYDKLIAAKEQGIPIAEDAFTRLEKRQQRLIEQGQIDTDLANEKTQRLAEEGVRNRYANQKEEERKLGNVFSALGTAESSAFMDQLGKVQRQGSADVTKLESTKLEQIASNNRQFLTYKQKINDFINEEEVKKNNLIREILNDVSLTESERTEALIKASMQAEDRVNQLKQNLQNAAIQFATIELQGKYDLQNTAMAGQNAINALNEEYKYNTAPYNDVLPNQDELPGGFKELYPPTNSNQKSIADKIDSWYSQGGHTDDANNAYIQGLINQFPNEKDFIINYFKWG